MVLLTMTAAMVACLEHYGRLEGDLDMGEHDDLPSLKAPAIGKPISHTQILAVSKHLKTAESAKKCKEKDVIDTSIEYHLDQLLRGSKVYIEPSILKAEPSSEYIALMARLRKEEEARQYERMINPPLQAETFSQRFPHSSATQLFEGSTEPGSVEDDEMTYADINRQMALIINILISIVACSAAIWIAAKHWSTPKRLGLSMGGSGMVAVAEIVVYAGYIRRLKEAKEKSKKVKEVKEVVKTWVIGGQKSEHESQNPESAIPSKKSNGHLRQRKAAAKG